MIDVVLPVRVYLEDTDAQGVVYNASYFRYLERARTEWLRGRGVDHNRLREQHGIMLVLSGIEAAFRVPARLDDMLYVSAEPSRVEGARVVFEQRIHRDSPNGEVVCQGVARVACVDVERGRPRRLPGALRDTLMGELSA